MADTNYFSVLVKLLEVPPPVGSHLPLPFTEVRASFPQGTTTKVLHLIFWGDFFTKLLTSFQPNDYLFVEGWLSLPSVATSKRKQFQLTVSKVYPIWIRSFPGGARSGPD